MNGGVDRISESGPVGSLVKELSGSDFVAQLCHLQGQSRLVVGQLPVLVAGLGDGVKEEVDGCVNLVTGHGRAVQHVLAALWRNKPGLRSDSKSGLTNFEVFPKPPSTFKWQEPQCPRDLNDIAVTLHCWDLNVGGLNVEDLNVGDLNVVFLIQARYEYPKSGDLCPIFKYRAQWSNLCIFSWGF